jgi:uncharacterized protein YndB with AHSA1/START domain
MTERSTRHSTFVIERDFEAKPARVFAAFADPAVKARWFVGPDDWESSNHSLDFRVGGVEHVSGAAPGGSTYSFDARYQDIVPDERIIYAYDMHMNEARISVSLATIEFQPAGASTHLILTEQGAFLEGYDDPAERERGTKELLDALDAELQREPATA